MSNNSNLHKAKKAKNDEFVPVSRCADYEISKSGVVRNKLTNKVIKATLMNNGYYAVALHNKKVSLHRLLAEAFIPNPSHKPEIDHIDGNPRNNSLTNLRWATHRENLNNIITVRREINSHIGKLGYDCHNSKTVLQFSEDGNFIKEWPCLQEIKRQLGFAPSMLSRACRGIIKSYKGFVWKYKEV